MPEHFDPLIPGARRPAPQSFGEAIAALPLPMPPRDGWPAVQARLQRRRRQRRLSLALAASIAMAAVLGALLSHWMSPASVSPSTSVAESAAAESDANALRALLAESAQLEALLAWSGEQWAETGDSVALDQQLAERLQQVDLQLAQLEQQTDASAETDELLLWSQRVQLLRQRARLAGAGLLLADGGPSAGEAVLTL